MQLHDLQCGVILLTMARKKSKQSKPRPRRLPTVRELEARIAQELHRLGISSAENGRDRSKLEVNLQTPRFLPVGYRIQKSTRRTRHLLGGDSPSAACGACGTPLILFANLDAADQRLRNDHKLKRLPLYYCCSCPGPVFYQVSGNGNVQVLPSRNEPYDEAPFENPPNALRPGFLTLKLIRAELETAIFKVVAGSDEFKSLTKSQLSEISSVLGRKPRGRWEMYFSQVGGLPLSFQGEEGMPDICPNRSCTYRRRKRAEFKFRPLAVLDLWNDNFWQVKPLDAVQVVFHICPGCHCISAKYTCT